ncbi:MAG: phosphate regulon transcriptional regulator PhoB [Rhodospirillaceae bacterium]|nr:phosphate regulon transcriptional regulator PhoB [Rhodospirillaceae bacterium]
MTDSPLILVIEDETSLTTLLRYNLESHRFRVASIENGGDAMSTIASTKPDLVLLDWMLPGVSGIEICRKIRRDPETHNLPVILLTARGEESDRVRGLDCGADDYVVKPFVISELIARIGAVLRRAAPTSAAQSLASGDITMDLASYRVSRSGRSIHLGPTEYRLLRHFMEHPGRVLSRDHLLEAVWGRAVHIEQRTVDVHVRRLRQALNGDGEVDVIRTVRSAGYAFSA